MLGRRDRHPEGRLRLRPDPRRGGGAQLLREILGLRQNPRDSHEFETANVTLALWEPEAQGVPFAPNTAGIALRVSDVGAARRRLESSGVRFLGDTLDTGVCHMGFFYDPDGNVLILHRRYAPID